MSSFEERLRDLLTAELAPNRRVLIEEAITRIERLQTALEEIVALEYDHESMVDVARIALKPEGPVL